MWKLISLIAMLSFIKETLSKIFIAGPHELATQFLGRDIEASYSVFGTAPSGFYTRGRIYYDLKDKEDDYACKPLDVIEFAMNEKDVDNYPILMLDRGDCTFVTKARNAQNIGARIALVVNDEEGPVENILMIDDGTGSDVNIPVILIRKEDGDIIKKFMNDNRDKPEMLAKIKLEIDFETKESKVVEWNLFLSSTNKQAYTILKQFYPYHVLFGNTTKFEPFYVTHTNPFRDPSNPKKANHCLSKGSYCSAPQFEQGISDGREIVLEDLRQKCIFQISNTKGEDYNPGAYFNYMSKFFNNCVNGTSPDFNYDCSMKTMKQINFNPEKVDDCIKKSFNVKSITEDTLEKDNNILERDTQYKKQYNVKLVPHLYINNSTMEGSWSAENLFKAICASFINKPFTCSVYFFAEIESDSTDLSWGAVLIVIILIVVLNAVIIYVCKKYIMKRIHERIEGIGAADLDGKINHVLSSYMALREQK